MSMTKSVLVGEDTARAADDDDLGTALPQDDSTVTVVKKKFS